MLYILNFFVGKNTVRGFRVFYNWMLRVQVICFNIDLKFEINLIIKNLQATRTVNNLYVLIFSQNPSDAEENQEAYVVKSEELTDLIHKV